MLADFLNKVREQAIGEMEQRAEALEGPGLPSAGRSECLNALFDELIAALRNALLKVSNHGPPIPPDVIPVLFEPFRRGVADDRLPRGLGLYIVQRLVQAHGGTIGVESSADLGPTLPFACRVTRPHRRHQSRPAAPFIE